MSLKIVRRGTTSLLRKLNADDALRVAVAGAAVTKEIGELLQFPPAAAAAGILLVIFETIQGVQSNKTECYRVARRALALLGEVREQMAGRWQSAPEALLRAIAKFEGTLGEIEAFMRKAAEQKWGTRLVRKGAIEQGLDDCNAALDDAARTFQIATLINIHIAIGASGVGALRMGNGESTMGSDSEEGRGALRSVLPEGVDEERTLVMSDVEELCGSPTEGSATSTSFELVSHHKATSSEGSGNFELLSFAQGSSHIIEARAISSVEDEYEEELVITNHHGFRRYHQSEIVLKGKSRIKTGWWAGAVDAQVAGGQHALSLRYDGSPKAAMKRWVRDVKILQNVHHPNLPQMIGYSDDESPTQFILLANMQTRLPQALLLDSIRNSSIAACARLLCHFYRDTLDASLYLQRQMGLSDSKLQDYVEHASYRIDPDNTVIMGLPPPEIDNVTSFRNYGLAESVRDIYLKILPNRGHARQPVSRDDQSTSDEAQRKVNHLAVLARALLPQSKSIDLVHARLARVLGGASSDNDEDEEDEPDSASHVPLRLIRVAAFEHQDAWAAGNVEAHKYAVGDLAYVPAGAGTDGEFVVLGNVLADAAFALERETFGSAGHWDGGFYKRQPLQPYALPEEVYGWTVVAMPESKQDLHVHHISQVAKLRDAWMFLLERGKAMAERHGVRPEDLVLVTKVGVAQQFKVTDLRKLRYWHNGTHPNQSPGFGRGPSNHFGQPFHGHGRGGGQGGLVPGQDLSPLVMFLFTSGNTEHTPYFPETPLPTPLAKGVERSQLKAHCWASADLAYGYMDYVQLHAEDFMD